MMTGFSARMLAFWCVMLASGSAQIQSVTLPGQSPLVSFRFVFRIGAAFDPADKPGLAALTSHMLAEGGTRQLTRKQILDRLYPLAASVSCSVDKEMTVFSWHHSCR